VFSNTADTITCPIAWDWAIGVPANPDTFEIVDPPVNVEFDHAVTFVQGQPSDGKLPGAIFSSSRTRMSIAGFFLYSNYASKANFHAIGDSMTMNWCTLKVPVASAPYSLRVTDCNLNTFPPANPTLFDDPQLSDTYTYGLMLAQGVAPPAPGGSNNYIGSASVNSEIVGVCSRAQHFADRGECVLKECAFAHVQISERCIVYIRYAYFSDEGLSDQSGITIREMADLYMRDSHIESVGGADGIELFGQNRVHIEDVTANAANLSGYGVRIGALCTLWRDSGATIAGTTNDYYFVFNTTAGAWAASANDTGGSFLVTG
jgi:hypothetical protein